MVITQPSVHCLLVFWIEFQFLLGGNNDGASVEESPCCLVLYITGMNPPCVNIFQSSMSSMDEDAASMKMTSISLLIIDLLNTLCFVIIITFLW